jgi:citrate lyase subunit beta/citryl-CoA lyase
VPSPSSDRPVRSWLFAPGHNPRILAKAFEVGADEVLLDLEDGVGPDLKEQARRQVVEVISTRPAWVRINPARSAAAELDLQAVGGLATGLRIPKVESPEDISWVRERLAGRPIPLTASVESALGLLNALAVAGSAGVQSLTFGNMDFAADIGADSQDLEAMSLARSTLVLVSRAAGIQAPSDGVFANFKDDAGLRAACLVARRLGFGGKSAIHPNQVPIINEIFSPTPAELEWAQRVVSAYRASGGTATRVGDEMIDVPVYERALRLLR